MTWYITGNANIDATKYLGTNNNQPLVIKTNSTADPSEKMRVNPDGGVGIGKTPEGSYRLDVAGVINATGVHVNGAPLATGGGSQWTSMTGGINYAGGNVGIGATTLSRKLHVEGSEIHSGGPGAGYSFGNRQTAAFVDGPAAGERWVW